ncbi:hypothetical protein QQ054_38295 [Oscillatoria amoena NRMC-F 0135]|nr:hypothetical protein [Desertifilum sp.]MDI9639190.1 hypothetical protein [Geitlerinema splendidum]MDL5051859.1 hypothetical protein [Oscillatoria amoena NRMC-F 0135]
MCKEAYDALNHLAQRFHQTIGTEGQASEIEAAQIVAEYINALSNQLSDEDLVKALDEFRAGQDRMKRAATTIKLWQDSDEGQAKSVEFQRFIADLYARMSYPKAG